MIFLIQYAKSQNIRNADEWAESALESAKSDPELATDRRSRVMSIQTGSLITTNGRNAGTTPPTKQIPNRIIIPHN